MFYIRYLQITKSHNNDKAEKLIVIQERKLLYIYEGQVSNIIWNCKLLPREKTWLIINKYPCILVGKKMMEKILIAGNHRYTTWLKLKPRYDLGIIHNCNTPNIKERKGIMFPEVQYIIIFTYFRRGAGGIRVRFCITERHKFHSISLMLRQIFLCTWHFKFRHLLQNFLTVS